MGVSRCCCEEEPPIVWGWFCRAWNSVVNQEFDNLVPLSGAMPDGINMTYPNASLSDPEKWSYIVRTWKKSSLAVNYSVQPKNPGIETKILGLQNQQLPRITYGGIHQELETWVNFKNTYYDSNMPQPSSRFNNEPSYPSKWLSSSTIVPDSFRPVFEFKINVRDMSPSVEHDSTVAPELSGYKSHNIIKIMNGQNSSSSLQYFSAVDPVNTPPKTPNVWYFGFGNSPVLDTAGNSITATFPCEIKFVSTNNKGGIYTFIDLYIDGVKTNSRTLWYPNCTVYGKMSHWYHWQEHPVVALFQFAPMGRETHWSEPQPTYPNFTTPDQIIDIESVEYKIGNGHQEYLNTINWQINNGNNEWSYDPATGTIDANNLGTGFKSRYVLERYAHALLNLKANSHYKIEWLSAFTGGIPGNNERVHPFLVINNFELSAGQSATNRFLDSLFFNTNSSGQTSIKFVGWENRRYDISDIRIWLVWEPLNIVYPSPFTNDATAPATNIDWRLVDGGATITPTIAGGKEPYSVTVQSGSLPPGCTINSVTGVITLAPAHTQASYDVGEVTIRVTDMVSEEHDATYFWERLN